jgi:hypothetical protein
MPPPRERTKIPTRKWSSVMTTTKSGLRTHEEVEFGHDDN